MNRLHSCARALGAVTRTCLVPCVPKDDVDFGIAAGRGLIQKCLLLIHNLLLEPEYFKRFSAFIFLVG